MSGDSGVVGYDVRIDLDDLSMMREAVNQRDDTAGVGEYLVPLSEGLVRGDPPFMMHLKSY